MLDHDKSHQEELANLIDARNKINARIKELQHEDSYRSFGTVVLSKGENERNQLWKNVYRIKIKKHSSMIESENGKFRAITEDPDLNRTYLYIKKVSNDLLKCIEYIENVLNAAKHEDK